jgi:hypothetical protein
MIKNMKTKRPLIIAVCGLLILACAWYFTAPPPPDPVVYAVAHTRLIRSNLLTQTVKYRIDAADLHELRARSGVKTNGMPTGPHVEPPPETNEPPEIVPAIDPKYLNPTNWPEDSRPEVKEFYRFAKAAKLYKFDPAVTACKDSLRYQKTVASATHEADIDTRSQRITDIYSYRERSHSMVDYSGVTDDWVNATGTWNENQMVDETFRILRELGYANTLAAVSQGRHEFHSDAWRANLPDGGFKIVYPFATVKLYGPNVSGDPNEGPRVTAEYRMGPHGPVGLVDWFSLY